MSARRKEINLYKTLGFTDDKIEQILYRENLLVPLYAIATGVISALTGAGVNYMNTGIWVWIMALLFTIFFVFCTMLFIKNTIRNEIKADI
jgi:putative ABC transport system permease protein